MLNAWIMKPVNQETGKKYPLLITQYSGPNSQQVKNNWSLSWLNCLAQEGISLPVSTRVVRQLVEKSSGNVRTCNSVNWKATI